MAIGTHRAPDIDRKVSYSGPHGNLSVAYSKVVVPATGVDTDTVDHMRMPRGTRIVDCIRRNSGDTNGATTTLETGIAQIPGKASTKVDADALIKAATLTTGNKLVRRDNEAVGDADLTLDDEYLIQSLVDAADIGTAAVTIELWVIYENVGA
jgi:hypothetical protein